jgi:PmbA protein
MPSSSTKNPGAGAVTEALDGLATTMDRLAAMALEHAKKIGADAAKIATSASFQKRLVVEAKEFSLANSLESRSFAVAVFKDQKKGTASINTLDERSVQQAVADALALATYSVPDPALTLATRDEAPPAPRLPFLFDAALAEMSLEEIQGVMAETMGILTRDKRLALDRFEMSVDASYHGLYASTGVRQTDKQSAANWYFFGMGRDGDEVSGFDYDGSFSYDKATIAGKAAHDATEFVKKVVGMLGPRQCPSYKGQILLSPRAVQEILLGTALYHISGRSVMDGKSLWEKSIGQQVMSPLFTLRDDPHDPRFSGATSFDGDGVPTRAMTIVDQGVLKLHLHDVYSAKKTGTKTTGSAGGPFAMSVMPGDRPLAAMTKARPELLMVDRFSGNSDPIKGDFSGVAKGSRLYVGGTDAGSVTETMIAGNFFEMAKAVVAVSDKAELKSGAFMSPYILVDGVSVTGQS